MSKKKEGITWEQAIEEAGALLEGHAGKSFAARAAEAEAWARQLDGTPAGRPIVRMGRPRKATPKVETELVTFRTDKEGKAALEALARSQGQSLSDLLREVTHALLVASGGGPKRSKRRAS